LATWNRPHQPAKPIRAIYATASGLCSSPWRQRSSPADAWRTGVDARSSTPSSLWCAAATSGGPCPTICRHGKRPVTSSGSGATTAPGRRSTRYGASGPGGTWGARRGRARRSWTAGRSRPGKGGLRGDDAHQQVIGRKRHLLVETQGFVLTVVVAAADVQDRDGTRLLTHALRQYGPEAPRLSLLWADAG